MTSPEEPESKPAGDESLEELSASNDSGNEAPATPAAEKAAPVPERPASFVVRCPACGAETVAIAEQAGKRGQCTVCGGMFLILPPPGFGPLPSAETVANVPPFEGPPHRAQTVFGVGLAAILSTAIATVITACCAYIPVDIVPVIIGLMATFMGRHDLKAMDRGEMDPAGRERTRLGFALGIAAACISGVFFAFRVGIMAIAIAFALAGAAVAPPPGPAAAPPKTATPATGPAQTPTDSDDETEPVVPPDVQGLPR